jgi:hypothetical protein
MTTKRNILVIGIVALSLLLFSGIYIYITRFDHLIYFYYNFTQRLEIEGLVSYSNKIKANVSNREYNRLLEWMIRQVNNSDIFNVAYAEIIRSNIKVLIKDAEFYNNVIKLKPEKTIIMEYL